MSAPVVVTVLVAAAVVLLPRGRAHRLLVLVRDRPPDVRRRPLRVLARPGRGRPTTDVAAVAAELAALTRGGLAPSAAWSAVAPGLADDPAGRALRQAADGAARGEPVGDRLRLPAPRRRRRRPANERAREQLTVLAATLTVQEATGAPVADLLERTAAGLRSDADADLARRSALAAPLATARVLVGLPPVGLLLGIVVGGDPVRVLVHEPAGRASAAVGALCAALGWAWSRALVRRAVRSSP